MTNPKAFAIDLAERAAFTFVETAGGTVASLYLAGAIDNVADVAAWKKLAIAAGASGLAAVISVVKSALAGLKTGTASVSPTVAATAVPQPPAA